MPGVHWHAIQRSKYFVVYFINIYWSAMAYRIFFCFVFSSLHNFFSQSRACKHIIVHMQTMDFQDLVDTLCFVDSHRKASRTWNRNRLNCNGMSVDITGRREMRTSRFDLPFRRFTYITTHSPTLLSLHLRHNSFYNSSVASPTHTHFTYITWLAAHELKLDKNDVIILKYGQQPTILYLKIQPPT